MKVIKYGCGLVDRGELCDVCYAVSLSSKNFIYIYLVVSSLEPLTVFVSLDLEKFVVICCVAYRLSSARIIHMSLEHLFGTNFGTCSLRCHTQIKRGE